MLGLLAIVCSLARFEWIDFILYNNRTGALLKPANEEFRDIFEENGLLEDAR